ncbi:MAG: GNAT family N-acetyltransferase [Bacilli bacterium]|jgi:ribosomal-protein-alanine N-acetyltransferase
MNAPFRIRGKIIETKRLILRPFRLEDLDDFHQYASVPGVGEMAGWPHHQNQEETLRVLKNFMEKDRTFAVCFKANNQVIGSLGVERYGKEEVLSEFFPYQGRRLGFVLSKDYWGQGLMPEALTAVIDYLFNQCDFDFLLCGYYLGNAQSRRVQEKVGFKPYRKLIVDTKLGTKETTIEGLLINPKKKIEFKFSHPETLIYEE